MCHFGQVTHTRILSPCCLFLIAYQGENKQKSQAFRMERGTVLKEMSSLEKFCTENNRWITLFSEHKMKSYCVSHGAFWIWMLEQLMLIIWYSLSPLTIILAIPVTSVSTYQCFTLHWKANNYPTVKKINLRLYFPLISLSYICSLLPRKTSWTNYYFLCFFSFSFNLTPIRLSPPLFHQNLSLWDQQWPSAC